mmetsp:Transcript_144743/g.252318  ORF Transcript_144743/g.252318 Transcript_144743/m.252318 type:complete len:251 (+) Transcript_144743:2492-3244(+)
MAKSFLGGGNGHLPAAWKRPFLTTGGLGKTAIGFLGFTEEREFCRMEVVIFDTLWGLMPGSFPGLPDMLLGKPVGADGGVERSDEMSRSLSSSGGTMEDLRKWSDGSWRQCLGGLGMTCGLSSIIFQQCSRSMPYVRGCLTRRPSPHASKCSCLIDSPEASEGGDVSCCAWPLTSRSVNMRGLSMCSLLICFWLISELVRRAEPLKLPRLVTPSDVTLLSFPYTLMTEHRLGFGGDPVVRAPRLRRLGCR